VVCVLGKQDALSRCNGGLEPSLLRNPEFAGPGAPKVVAVAVVEREAGKPPIDVTRAQLVSGVVQRDDLNPGFSDLLEYAVEIFRGNHETFVGRKGSLRFR
jgi:hypothetical protein